MSQESPVNAGWDRIVPTESGPPETPLPPATDPDAPERSLLLAAVWGDLVAILVVGVAALVAVRAAGYPTSLAALPWAAGLALLWWLGGSGVLVVVRRGLPGMLAMGVSFEAPVPGRRLPWVLLVGLLEALLLGLPALAGSGCWARRWAAGSTVVVSDPARTGAP